MLPYRAFLAEVIGAVFYQETDSLFEERLRMQSRALKGNNIGIKYWHLKLINFVLL